MQLGMDSACTSRAVSENGPESKEHKSSISILAYYALYITRALRCSTSAKKFSFDEGVMRDIVFVIKNCRNCAVYLINVIVNNGVEQYNDFKFLGHLSEGACHLGSLIFEQQVPTTHGDKSSYNCRTFFHFDNYSSSNLHFPTNLNFKSKARNL
jgi:hypothetical protein